MQCIVCDKEFIRFSKELTCSPTCWKINYATKRNKRIEDNANEGIKCRRCLKIVYYNIRRYCNECEDLQI